MINKSTNDKQISSKFLEGLGFSRKEKIIEQNVTKKIKKTKRIKQLFSQPLKKNKKNKKIYVEALIATPKTKKHGYNGYDVANKSSDEDINKEKLKWKYGN